MVAFTPNRGYPYSTNSDPADIPAAIEAFVRAVDLDMQNHIDSLVRRPFAKVSSRSTTPQTFNSDAVTQATFDFVDVDSDGISDLTNRPTRLTPTSAGLWLCWGMLVTGNEIAAADDLYIFVNETALDRSNFTVNTTTSSRAITVATMSFMDGVDDYFTLRMEPDQGSEDFRVTIKQMACFRLTNT